MEFHAMNLDSVGPRMHAIRIRFSTDQESFGRGPDVDNPYRNPKPTSASSQCPPRDLECRIIGHGDSEGKSLILDRVTKVCSSNLGARESSVFVGSNILKQWLLDFLRVGTDPLPIDVSKVHEAQSIVRHHLHASSSRCETGRQ